MICYNIFTTYSAISYSLTRPTCMIWPDYAVCHVLTPLACVAPFYMTSVNYLCNMALT